MMSHTFAICAYKDSPYLDACIHSLKRQSVKYDLRLLKYQNKLDGGI